jgi:hypothetical protein
MRTEGANSIWQNEKLPPLRSRTSLSRSQIIRAQEVRSIYIIAFLAAQKAHLKLNLTLGGLCERVRSALRSALQIDLAGGNCSLRLRLCTKQVEIGEGTPR